MTIESINPATGEVLERFEPMDAEALSLRLQEAAAAASTWGETPVAERCALLSQVASVLRERRDALARQMTAEMGKLLREAESEVDKCALACEHYAEHAPAYLADEEPGRLGR